MKFDKNSITKDKDNPAWKVGDLIYGVDNSLYLVARVADVDNRVSGHPFYTLVNLEDGYSSNSYETIAELQYHTGDPSDRLLTGTFKYEADEAHKVFGEVK